MIPPVGTEIKGTAEQNTGFTSKFMNTVSYYLRGGGGAFQ
jgi:hypothetical protein